MQKTLILFFALLMPWTAHAISTPETPQKVIYDVFVQKNGDFLMQDILFDAEGLGETLRRIIWQRKDASHFVRFNCEINLSTKEKLLLLKDWINAKYMTGAIKHAKCDLTPPSQKELKLHSPTQARMVKRTITKQERPFVGKWKGERKTPLGKIEYAWEVERKNDGSYSAHFFTPLENGQKDTIQKSNGFWWIEKGLYYEVQDNGILMPDIYQFDIQDQKIFYDQQFNAYQFTDFRYE
ncbi:MAG: hypothetical protein HWE34_02575 [Methylocystaceae bacterium]|nr:hypothetical protein [Methylocystaceae bacterium]